MMSLGWKLDATPGALFAATLGATLLSLLAASPAPAQIRIVETPPADSPPSASEVLPETSPDSATAAAEPNGETSAAPSENYAPAVAGPVPAPSLPAPQAAAGEPSRLDPEQVAGANPLALDGDPGDPGEHSGSGKATAKGAGERSNAAVRLAPPAIGATADGSATLPPIVDAEPRPRVAAGPRPTVIHLTDGRATNPTPIRAQDDAGEGDGIVIDQPQESPATAQLRRDIDRCLKRYSVLHENAATRSPWGMMHAFLPWGVDSQTIVGAQRVNSIGYLCWNGQCRKQKLFYQKNGEMGMYVGPGVQGHAGQFLAMLAQCRVDRNYEIRIDDYRYTIRDLIEYEKRTCIPRSELTFKLIAFSHYLDDAETWDNRYGRWNLERVLAEELAQPIVGSACGGTHRLMGITYALRARQAQGQPLTGHFKRAEIFIDDFQQYALALQNPDGSFSTDWFERRANAPDFDRKVQTTGHILEWLVYSQPAERLSDPQIVRSVRFLTDALNENPDYEFEVGPKGHALRALVLYQRLVFDGTWGQGTVDPAALAAEPEAALPSAGDIR